MADSDPGRRGLVRSIICGCQDWEAVDMLDDDLDFRTAIWQLPGCSLRTDVVYDRPSGGGPWRLCSVCLTFDDRWAVDYGFAAGPPVVRVCEYIQHPAGMKTPRLLGGLGDLPIYHAQLIRTMDPYLCKLALVSRVLPIHGDRVTTPPMPATTGFQAPATTGFQAPATTGLQTTVVVRHGRPPLPSRRSKRILTHRRKSTS